MRIYNTLSHKEEELKIDGKKIKLYTCGPTVYDFAHVGNFRSYVFADVLKRYLKYKGFKVDHVMNITDVDDKLIRKTIKEKKPLKEITDFFLDAFMNDMKNMRMDMDYEKIPRATESIDVMVKIIQKLLEKGIAYEKEDGIYYDISKFDHYGKLVNLDIKSLKSGARVSQDEYDKNDAHDFALWKFYDDEDGDVFWETPIGKGRPGWHIECSAMSMDNLDETIDIHTGGIDLAFPHHTNEIAQSEGSTGKPFVRYWMHNEHLMVDGKKMAKSAGNFYTIRDLVGKGFNYRTIRFFLLSSHYRSQMNLTTEALEAASRGLDRIDEFMNNLRNEHEDKDPAIESITDSFLDEWERMMDDNLNTPEAVALMFDYIKTVNKEMEKGISKSDAKKVIKAMEKVDEVFVILDEEKDLPEGAKKLIKEREKARKNKDYQTSDTIRNELLKMGVEVKDEGEKTTWRVL